MDNLNTLLAQLPDEAKDIVVNAQRVLAGGSLNQSQTWGVALASAYFIGNDRLIQCVLADAAANGLSADGIEDARAAATIMGMNTVYFRFRHMMEKPNYEKMPPNLRMTRMRQVATTVVDFELYSIGPAALAGCELCLRSHEEALLKHDVTPANIHDAVRISAVLNGIVAALSTLTGRA